MRKEFELTQAQYDAILAASKPVTYMVIGGMEPSSPRENAHRAWQALGKDLGFDWETARPSERGTMFFTAVVTNPHFLTPCPVCGAEDDCPHTPVRCQHEWLTEAGNHHAGNAHIRFAPGDLRTCERCGRVELAALSWDTVKA